MSNVVDEFAQTHKAVAEQPKTNGTPAAEHESPIRTASLDLNKSAGDTVNSVDPDIRTSPVHHSFVLNATPKESTIQDSLQIPTGQDEEQRQTK